MSASPYVPQLILLELNMPEMDSIEFIRHLVEPEPWPQPGPAVHSNAVSPAPTFPASRRKNRSAGPAAT